MRLVSAESCDGIEKVDAFRLLNEGDGIPTNPAAKAVERVGGRVDAEVRPATVSVERTAPDQRAPDTSQVDPIACDDISDRSALLQGVSVNVRAHGLRPPEPAGRLVYRAGSVTASDLRF